jgi:hypothetical protein
MQQDQADIWKPSLLAGAVFGFLSGIPLVGFLNCACCSLIVGAGVLSSFLVIRASSMAVSYGRAALVGMLSGLFAVPFWLLADVLFTALMGHDFQEVMNKAIEQAQGVAGGGEEVAQVLAGIGMAGLMVIMFFILLVLWAPFGAVGGVLGRAIFERRMPPAAPQQPGQPPAGSWNPPAPPPSSWNPPAPPTPTDPGSTSMTS